MHTMSALALAAAFSLSMAAGIFAAQGDEAGTLKGVRQAPPPAAGTPKAKPKPGTGSGLMEEEGIYIRKPGNEPRKGK